MESSNAQAPAKTDSDLSNDAYLEKYINEVTDILDKSVRSDDELDLLGKFCKRLGDFRYILEGIEEDKMQGLLRGIKSKKVPCGEFVIKEGESCPFISVVIDGYVGLYQKNKDDLQKESFLKPCYRGAMFSELDMLYDRSSSVSGFVKVDAIIIAIERDVFSLYLHDQVSKHATTLYDFIHKSIPKSRAHIPNSEIETKYYYFFERKTMQKEELLAEEGRISDYMYFLISGEVKLYLPSKAYKALMVGSAIGKEMATIHKAGSCLTDESALQKEPLQYTVRVSSQTAEVYRVHQTTFNSKMPIECINAMRAELINKKRLRKQQMEKARNAKVQEVAATKPSTESAKSDANLPLGTTPELGAAFPPTEKIGVPSLPKEESSKTSSEESSSRVKQAVMIGGTAAGAEKKKESADKYQENLRKFQALGGGVGGGGTRALGSRAGGFGAAGGSGMNKEQQAALLKLRNQGLGLRTQCHQMADEGAELASFDVTKFANFRKLEKKNREGVTPGGKTDIISKLHAFGRNPSAGNPSGGTGGNVGGAAGFFRGLPTE